MNKLNFVILVLCHFTPQSPVSTMTFICVRNSRGRLASAIYGGDAANDMVQNIICLKTGICVETMSMTFHSLSVFAHPLLNGLRR